jgi:hypothetical protein
VRGSEVRVPETLVVKGRVRRMWRALVGRDGGFDHGEIHITVTVAAPPSETAHSGELERLPRKASLRNEPMRGLARSLKRSYFATVPGSSLILVKH